jgi:hypothetical protein
LRVLHRLPKEIDPFWAISYRRSSEVDRFWEFSPGKPKEVDTAFRQKALKLRELKLKRGKPPEFEITRRRRTKTARSQKKNSSLRSFCPLLAKTSIATNACPWLGMEFAAVRGCALQLEGVPPLCGRGPAEWVFPPSPLKKLNLVTLGNTF